MTDGPCSCNNTPEMLLRHLHLVVDRQPSMPHGLIGMHTPLFRVHRFRLDSRKSHR